MRPIAHHFAVLAVTLPAIACRASEAAPEWLQARAQQEARLAASSPALHDFRFTDQRQASGITFKNRIVDDAGKTYKLVHYDHGSGICAADVDRDGLLDLFVTNVGVFTSNTRGPGGYYFGLSDAFLGHLHPERAEASILYHNLGGNRFKDVTREVGLVDLSWSGDAVVLDANGDGFPDLFVLDMQGADHLWLNEGGKHFRDSTAAYFPRTPWGAMGAKVFDADGDGRLDLFITSMHPDMWVDLRAGDWAGESRKDDPAQMPGQMIRELQSSLIFGNALFENRGSGRFDEVFDTA